MNHEPNCPLSPNYQGGWAATVPPTCSCHTTDTAEKECTCHHFQKQIRNTGEGSYAVSIDWYCPVHGTMHKDFVDTAENIGHAIAKGAPGHYFPPATDTSDWQWVFNSLWYREFKNDYPNSLKEFRAFIEKELEREYRIGFEAGQATDKTTYMEAYEIGKQAERARVREIFLWLLGYTNFPERKLGDGAYWWRKDLRKKLEEADLLDALKD